MTVIFAFFAFFAGWMLNWPCLIGLLALGIISEANEAHGWAVFIGLISATVAYFFFSVTLATLLTSAAIYLVIGFIWSFWRYKRHADKIVEQYKDKSVDQKKYALEYLRPRRMLNEITTWVIVWPFSIVENITGDIIKIIQTTITKFFKGIYNRIFNNAASQLGIEDSKV